MIMYCVQTTDHELVTRYINGDFDALNILITRHKKRVYTAIYVLVRDQYVAEDIFQDTFFKVIDSLQAGSYKEEGKFLPWVLRISHNLCIDYFRKVKRKPVIVDSEGNDILDSIGMFDESAEDRWIRNQSIHSLRELIKQLPDEQREVLILRHYAELSFKEIAEMTNVSINTALGRMRYALLNLRKMVKEKKMVL
jgi:RNA polymerase sigma-70 factor (ECF subfamily)